MLKWGTYEKDFLHYDSLGDLSCWATLHHLPYHTRDTAASFVSFSVYFRGAEKIIIQSCLSSAALLIALPFKKPVTELGITIAIIEK